MGFYFAGAMILTSSVLVFFLKGVKQQSEIEERVVQDTYAESFKKMLNAAFLLQSAIVLQLGLPSRFQRQNSKTAMTRF